MTPRARVHNAADRQQVKAATKAERAADRDLHDKVSRVMSTKDGRDVMWALLDTLGPYRSVFHASTEIYYRAGLQDAGHHLIALLMAADPRMYLQMQTENIGHLVPDAPPESTDDSEEETDNG